MKKFSTRSHHNSTDLFSYLTAEYKKQLFKVRRKDLLTKGLIDVYFTWPLSGQVVARVEWLDVALLTVKPENAFSQFSLYLGPRYAGDRNPDL